MKHDLSLALIIATNISLILQEPVGTILGIETGLPDDETLIVNWTFDGHKISYLEKEQSIVISGNHSLTQMQWLAINGLASENNLEVEVC